MPSPCSSGMASTQKSTTMLDWQEMTPSSSRPQTPTCTFKSPSQKSSGEPTNTSYFNAMTTINKIKIAESFMEVMQDYMKRQYKDPNFDVNASLYDLYSDLKNLYDDNA